MWPRQRNTLSTFALLLPLTTCCCRSRSYKSHIAASLLVAPVVQLGYPRHLLTVKSRVRTRQSQTRLMISFSRLDLTVKATSSSVNTYIDVTVTMYHPARLSTSCTAKLSAAGSRELIKRRTHHTQSVVRKSHIQEEGLAVLVLHTGTTDRRTQR